MQRTTFRHDIYNNDFELDFMVYPRSLCTDPPLKSEFIHECGDRCKSTVMIINDMSSDMHGRSKLIDKLKLDHDVLVFNNRGHYNVTYDDHGKIIRDGDEGAAQTITDYMPDPVQCKQEHGIDPYTIDFFIDDAVRVMDRHGVKKADVVGFSLGSFIGQGLAAKHPERVERLAIGKAFTRYNDYVRVARNMFSGPIFQGAYWFWCNARDRVNTDERDYGCNLPLSILDEYANKILNFDLTKYQLDIQSPSLVVYCKDDDLLGKPVTAIRDARIVPMNGCGHLFHAKNTEMYDVIGKFLNSKR